jgi:putative membrane protein
LRFIRASTRAALRLMKRVTLIAAIIAGAIWAADPAAVAAAIVHAGWSSLLVVGIRAISVSLAGLCWWLLLPPQTGLQPWVCVLLRIVREGGNTLLPLTQIGGDVVSVRLLTFWGVAGALASATVIVDVLLQAVGQFIFALTALGLLALTGSSDEFVHNAGIALLFAVPALAGFYIVQRQWGEALVTSILRRLARGKEWAVHGTVDALFQNLHAIYDRPGPVISVLLGHLVVWFFGALEVWVALTAMGYDVDFRTAIIIEGLAQAVRGAAFMVPGAVGVQEGGLIVLCGLFGIPAQSALALSLIKRAADIAIGGPGLVAWHALETSRFANENT